MGNGKVITAYLLFIAISALVPGLIAEEWLRAATIGGGLAVIWWIIASAAGIRILLKTIGAERLNVVKYSEIAKLVETKGNGSRNSVPSLWIIRNISPMLVTIGFSPRTSNLVFTQGFFERLDEKSQTGLVVRELQSIREGVAYANTGLATLLWIILLPGRLGGMIIGKKPGDPNILSTILNLLPAFFVGYPCAILGSDKIKVYALDSAALRKLDNPDYLPYGLMKIQESILAGSFDCDLSLSGCCVIHPGSRDPFQALLRLHPPTPKRIDRLRIKADSSRKRFNK